MLYGLGQQGLVAYDSIFHPVRQIQVSDPTSIRAGTGPSRIQLATVGDTLVVCSTPERFPPLGDRLPQLRCVLVDLSSRSVQKMELSRQN